MRQPWLSNIRNDIAGGLASAAVAIPLALGFGMFAFVSLGDEYFAVGALAGLYAAFIVGITAVVTGSRTTIVYAPRVTSTFFIGSLLYGLVHSNIGVIHAGGPSVILLIFFVTLLLGGVFQLLFGLIKIGTLIKFTPHPVMAGFQNMAAALLFLVQLGNVCGLDKNTPFTAVLSHLGMAKPLSVIVAVITFAAMWNSRKFIPKVPPIFVGLVLGTGLYYGLTLIGFASLLGPTIGATNVALATTPFANIPDLSRGIVTFEVSRIIITGALALALIASIDALLCVRLASQPGDDKVDGNHLLVTLGIGNIASAFFGGITSGLNIGASLVNRAFGGRTPLSVVVNSAVVLLTTAFAFPLIAHLPRVALSAVIMVIAVQHFDPWTKQLIRRIASSRAQQRRILLLELFVVLLVAVLSIALDIVLAVFLGVIIAIILFVVRMSRSNIRRMYRCNSAYSRKSRTSRQVEVLEKNGSSILVMELQGVLFFGSAEKLTDEIETATRQETRFLVLDMRRVDEIDSTGSRILLEIQADLARRGIRLALSIAMHGYTAGRLADFGALGEIGLDKIFEDVDRAIQWAEDAVLTQELGDEAHQDEIQLEQVNILRNFNADEIAALKLHLVRAAHDKGSVIFREGDPGTDMFMITHGTASAYLHKPADRDIRLVTFAPGTVFGELAIMDAGPRSATIIADEYLVAYVLSVEGFAALSRQAPAVTIRLLTSLGRELSGRLRRANRMIHELET